MIVDWANSVTLQDAAAATGDGVVLAVGNRGAVGIGVSGTFVGTLTWESSYDGTNYFGILVLNYTTQVSALTATAPGIFYVAQPGIQFFRARISAYTSGSITVKAEAVPVTSGPEITNVTLSGDIEIGAVEIKNATDDTRAVVKTDGTNNALVVTQNAQPLPTLAATSTIQATQQTSLDAINAVAGTTAGAAVVTDANGTLQQYLRGIVKLLITSGTIILGAGANIIGKVGIDQTTPGTTNGVAVLTAKGAGNVAINQVTAGAASGVLVAVRATRRSVTVRNQDAANSAYIGTGTVTSGNGFLLKFGESISIDTTVALNCIRDSADVALAYIEVYD